MHEKLNEAIIALGSNMGKREKNIVSAINLLSKVPIIKIENISRIYETKPYKVLIKQENFLNCCLKIFTNLSSQALLGACLGVEAALGRERPYRFASRTIDIDLICYESCKISTEELYLPHPRSHERSFVMAPINDLYPRGLPEYFGFNFGIKKFKDDSFENIFSYNEILVNLNCQPSLKCKTQANN
ncbi:MAG: 2-amino-4-hydroxy-6-hydroxymethyldihydropteridine diphosphokinase [Oscillospiraceae bacterium]|nr:2-amino-4-hydroxy-6-hydroxymethyldihydropteridine diphosphokinase [Oscillospiraceae bacterium]